MLLWLRGHAEQAVNAAQELVSLAKELRFPFGVTLGLHMLTLIQQWRREFTAAGAVAAAQLEQAREHGFALWQTIAAILHGAARVEQEQTGQGLEEICNGIVAYQATGARIGLPYYLALLAEAYAKCGQTEKALASLADGLSVIDRGGERWWKAELLRLRGELLLQSQSRRSQHELQEQAEACFREAMITARRQGAKSLELRAVTSFSRLCREGRKKKQAFQMLSQIYGSFNEGFETADLVEARALLSELVSGLAH